MRLAWCGILVCLGVSCLAPLPAQTPSPSAKPTAATAEAEAEVERVRRLVEVGALPRKALDDARAAVDDEADRQILERTLYGKIALEELTEEQSREMISAAERRMLRRRKLLDDAKARVESGVLPITGLTLFVEQFDSARKVHEQTVGRARLFQQLAEMVRAEQEMEARMDEATADNLRQADRFDGDGALSAGQSRAIELSFEKEFGRPLPVSARGETVLHRTLGFDHRGRLDVAVNPASREGMWLRRFLEVLRVPYLVFYGPVAGQATGAHIHVGPPSNRIRRTD